MMKFALLPATLAALLAGDALAQNADAAITLGSVKARQGSGGTLPASQVLTSVDVLGGDQVEDQNVMNSWELLGQMPGIQLTETRQGAESGKATFRAFNGEGYINGIKVLIDGVPSNVNSGNQRFIDMVFPLDIAYIEVVRGTNDPRYGLHNIGGNINFGTRQGGNYTDGRLSYGSFNTREAQLALGREADGFAQNYFLGVQASDGYRHDNDHSEKYSVGGKWFYGDEAGGTRIGLIARAYHHQADEPGFLTAEQMAQDRFQSPAKNANDGDDRDMRQLSVHLDMQLAERLHLGSKLYYNRYQDDRTVTFSDYPQGDAPRQRRIWDERQLGLLSTATWGLNEALTLEGGINAEHQDDGYVRYRYRFSVPTDFSAAPSRTQNDDRYSLDNTGAYVQAVIQPVPALKIVPAYRVDRFSGNTQLPNGVDAPLQRYGNIEQPKLSVVYAINPSLNAYANWGRTFQVLTGSTAPAYLTPGQGAFRPSINTGTEFGLKLQTAQLQARVSAWQQDATDEVANMPATGTSVGLGQTRRRGVDLQASLQLGDAWRLWGSHAIQEAKVVSAFAADGSSLAGKEVFSTPRYISNLGVDYRFNKQLDLGLQARMQGDYYIDSPNLQGKYGGFAVMDLNARYALSDRLSLDLQVRNLADRDYAYVWYDSFFWGGQDQPMFSAAPGRAFYLSLNFKL